MTPPRQPPAMKTPAPPSNSSFGRVLGALAVAVGVGAIGAYMLDLHGHTCTCGKRWRHFGAFNLGDAESHTCSQCGQVQWWKDGAPHVLRGSQFAASPTTVLGIPPPLPQIPLPPLPPAIAAARAQPEQTVVAYRPILALSERARTRRP